MAGGGVLVAGCLFLVVGCLFLGCRQCVLFAGGLFLVAGGLLPGTQRTNSASRAQNRGFCAREEVKVASGSIRVIFLQITAHTFNT